MSARRYVAGLATAAVAAATLATAPAAQADPAFVPVADDFVGAGSDTSMFALNYLADGHDGVAGYNEGRTSGRLVSFDAKTPTNSDTVVLATGRPAITRPNGSGAGKGLLYGPSNNSDLDYARSSSALSAAEISAGLYAFPFALDVLEMAVSKSSNAPAQLTEQQILAIYSGTVTNWSQVGGTSGVIVPMIPQSGSGTRSFFESELKRINGGNTVNLASSVREVQEHDDTEIKDDANAIAPFSAGRGRIEGTVDLVGGEFSAKRALYNVVRQADVADPEVLDLFGEDGFICSIDARPLIEAAGFDQLATPDADGVCGEATQEATANFTTNDAAATTTALTATSPAGGAVRLTATVAADGNSADGAVEFFEGETSVGTAQIAQGQAVLNLAGVTSGQHQYSAVFVPASVAFGASTSEVVSVTVKGAAQVNASVTPGSTTYGKAAKVSVKVTGASATPTGAVRVKVGPTTVSGTLAAGSAMITLPANVAAGNQTVTVTYAGDATYAAATATGQLKVAKATSKLKAKAPKKIKKGKTGKATITVSVPGSSVKVTGGTATIKKGKVVVGKGAVKNGKVKLKLAKLKKGKNKLTVSYAGNASVKGSKAKVTVTQK
ncbi:Ig-like domain repeat protein [Nocardioides alcanivorans]|uniref:Ig-like domain repeat protein n=1 Tax=Nocardioides alcanivorans TaxID=2897352 RepID=UPI001F46A4C1|nr:Ig-like domain repeat protein [Nocardioides alcanivorans]